MTGFGAFLGKEMKEIVRTWRIWVLPGMLLFFAVTSPVIAQLTPALMKSLSASQPGVLIKIPPPTALDSYAQFLKNLTQITVLAIVISAAGIVSSEVRSGSAILVLTKPVSRPAFVVAKASSQSVLLTASTVVSSAVCVAGTVLLFEVGPVVRFVTAVGLWLVFALLMTAVMVLLSAVLDSQAGASGAGLGVFAALSILALWGPARAWSPVGLLPLAGEALAGNQVESLWPVTTGLAAAVLTVAVAAALFRRREL